MAALREIEPKGAAVGQRERPGSKGQKGRGARGRARGREQMQLADAERGPDRGQGGRREAAARALDATSRRNVKTVGVGNKGGGRNGQLEALRA